MDKLFFCKRQTGVGIAIYQIFVVLLVVWGWSFSEAFGRPVERWEESSEGILAKSFADKEAELEALMQDPETTLVTRHNTGNVFDSNDESEDNATTGGQEEGFGENYWYRQASESSVSWIQEAIKFFPWDACEYFSYYKCNGETYYLRESLLASLLEVLQNNRKYSQKKCDKAFDLVEIFFHDDNHFENHTRLYSVVCSRMRRINQDKSNPFRDKMRGALLTLARKSEASLDVMDILEIPVSETTPVSQKRKKLGGVEKYLAAMVLDLLGKQLPSESLLEELKKKSELLLKQLDPRPSIDQENQDPSRDFIATLYLLATPFSQGPGIEYILNSGPGVFENIRYAMWKSGSALPCLSSIINHLESEDCVYSSILSDKLKGLVNEKPFSMGFWSNSFDTTPHADNVSDSSYITEDDATAEDRKDWKIKNDPAHFDENMDMIKSLIEQNSFGEEAISNYRHCREHFMYYSNRGLDLECNTLKFLFKALQDERYSREQRERVFHLIELIYRNESQSHIKEKNHSRFYSIVRNSMRKIIKDRSNPFCDRMRNILLELAKEAENYSSVLNDVVVLFLDNLRANQNSPREVIAKKFKALVSQFSQEQTLTQEDSPEYGRQTLGKEALGSRMFFKQLQSPLSLLFKTTAFLFNSSSEETFSAKIVPEVWERKGRQRFSGNKSTFPTGLQTHLGDKDKVLECAIKIPPEVRKKRRRKKEIPEDQNTSWHNSIPTKNKIHLDDENETSEAFSFDIDLQRNFLFSTLGFIFMFGLYSYARLEFPLLKIKRLVYDDYLGQFIFSS